MYVLVPLATPTLVAGRVRSDSPPVADMQIYNPSMQDSGPSDKITKQINFPSNAKANQQQKNPLKVERPVERGERRSGGVRAAFVECRLRFLFLFQFPSPFLSSSSTRLRLLSR